MNTGDIIIAIRPKWCAKEYTGEKHGELRKGWFEGCEGKKFYIYCSSVKAMNLTDYCEAHRATGGAIDDWSGKVIGEFICDRIDRFTAEFVDEKKHGLCYEDIRRVWINDDGEEEYQIITANDENDPSNCDLCRDTCLSFEDIKAYIGENFHEKKFCYINFSNLAFYDEPKDLGSFYRPGKEIVCKAERCEFCKHWKSVRVNAEEFDMDCEINYVLGREKRILTRPPQSYCYVMEA